MDEDTLYDQIVNSRGWKIHRLTKMYWHSHQIFQRNHAELRAHLLVLQNPGEAMRIAQTQPKAELHLETLRLFHNLLASAYSLSQHEEAVVKHKLVDRKHRTTHRQMRSAAFDKDALFQFMYDLRNYAQHNDIPLTQVVFSWDNPQRTAESVVRLDLRRMKSWDWKTGKSYFTSVKGEPSLLEMVDTYEQAVTNFAKRFLTWFQELYKADVDRTNVLIRESNGPPEEWEELLGRPQSPSPQSPP